MRLRAHILVLFLVPMYLAGQTNSSYKFVDTVSTIETEGKTANELINEANGSAISNPVKSNKLATAALEKSIAENDKQTQSRSYNTLGTLYFNSGNYTAAIKYFELASSGFAEMKDEKSKAYSDKYLALSKTRLAGLEKYYVENSKSGKFKNSEKNSVIRKNDIVLKSKANSGITASDKIDIYKELGEYYLENKDTVQSTAYINEAAKITLQAPDNVVLSNTSALNTFYTTTGNFNDNIRFQQNVVTEGRRRGNSNIVGNASHNLGSTYNTLQQSETAIPYLQESIDIAYTEKNIEQKQKSVKELAKAYENLGQYDKALSVIKDYLNTFDSLQNVQYQNVQANLALNQEFAKQEARIQKLITSQKENEASYKRQRSILWSLAIALCLFGLLTWLLILNIRQKQKANMQIKLQSLRTQMNPHFIFNSLNSVNNFISKNDERSANRYLSDFSTLMRTVLKNSDQDFVPLETEIQTLKIYLDLEHFRFGEKFDYSLEVAEDIDPNLVQVPPMLIQPYIENAIWHGLRYKEEKGRLEVKFYTENGKLYCTVKDNGIGREKSASLKTDNQKTYQSTGIKNTKERIEILNKLHGTKLHISIFDLRENGSASGTMARISIPYKMQLEEV